VKLTESDRGRECHDRGRRAKWEGLQERGREQRPEGQTDQERRRGQSHKESFLRALRRQDRTGPGWAGTVPGMVILPGGPKHLEA
jgi:hypothetical protein